MENYVIALTAEHFILNENTSNGDKCIWCLKAEKKNNAHIISRKIIKQNTTQNILRKSVCVECNTKWGRIEDWLMKKSPLNLFRFLYHRNKSKGITNIPQFIYHPEALEWLAIYIEKSGNLVSHKQILFQDGIPKKFILGEGDKNDTEEMYNALLKPLTSNKTIEDLNDSLPSNFCDRIIITNETNIIVGKNSASIQNMKEWLETEQYSPENTKTNTIAYEVKADIYENLTMQYYWSDDVWKLYGLKIFFEFLAMHKGSDFCLNENFNCIRRDFLEFILPEKSTKIILDQELTFITKLQNKKLHINFLKRTMNSDNTGIDVTGDIRVYYEIKKFTLTSCVQIGFFPQVKICIETKRNNIEFDFFYTSYNYEKNDFFNLRLTDQWLENRILLFNQNLKNPNYFNDYPNRYKKFIPIKKA